MIGLIDLDLQLATSIRLHPPNLEIMKLATYYKIEEQKFCRLINLNETELTGYNKIYIFSEKHNLSEIPTNFLYAPNIILGGTGLTNGQYIPFENEIIDFTLPRPAIYKEFLKEKYQDGIKANIIGHILDDTYYRYKAGDKKLPLPSILPKKRLWLFDRELFQDDWQDWVQEAIERKTSGIYTIHPINCTKMSEYLAIRKIPKISRNNAVLFNIHIPLNEINYFFKEYKNFFLEDIVNSSEVYLPVGGTKATSFLYFQDLIYKLNLLYSFWAQNIPMKIKYIPPNLGTHCAISNLLIAIEEWSRSHKKDWTINNKIIKKTIKMPTEEYLEELMILKFYPKIKDLFEQTYEDLSKRRIWRV